MIIDAVLAYLHLLSIFFLAFTLLREWALLRGGPPALDIKALARTDRHYLFAAVAVIASGVGRILLGIKPWAFYAHNPLFHAKIGLFVLLGILSIKPTLAFIRWRRAQAADVDYRVAPNDWRFVRRMLLIELHLLALIPLLATLMARGVGLHS
jgi:putative membrane protein